MGDVDPKQKFFRISEAARKLGISCDQLRRLADRGQIPAVWRGSHRLFPVHSTLAYAQRNDPKKGESDADALALGMIQEGRTDEEIVLALRIPLERVDRLRAPRDRLAKTRAAASREELAEDARSSDSLRRMLAEGRQADARRVAEHVQQLLPPSKLRA